MGRNEWEGMSGRELVGGNEWEGVRGKECVEKEGEEDQEQDVLLTS